MAGSHSNSAASDPIDAECRRFLADRRAQRILPVSAYGGALSNSDLSILRLRLTSLEKNLRDQSAVETTSLQGSSVTRAGNGLPATFDHVSDAPSTRGSDSPAPFDAQRGTPAPVSLPAAIDRFQIRALLGQGGFGAVYKAFDPYLKRDVAIKRPREGAVRTPEEREAFLREARVVATIDHPSICQVYEVGECDGRPYIVMAYVDGSTLAETLKSRSEPFTGEQAARIVRTIAAALAAAHGQGIVHRDLKPGNLMFHRGRKDVIVMDFGLARGPILLGGGRESLEGEIKGTPAYMSPEQARGEVRSIGPTSDVFSLGVIFYELLAGRRPFQGKSPMEVIASILRDEPKAPSAVRAGVEPRLEAVCLRAMAKETRERFATMQEFADAIDSALKALKKKPAEVRATPVPPPVSPVVARVPPIVAAPAARAWPASGAPAAVEPRRGELETASFPPPPPAADVDARPMWKRELQAWPWEIVAGLCVGVAAIAWFLLAEDRSTSSKEDASPASTTAAVAAGETTPGASTVSELMAKFANIDAGKTAASTEPTTSMVEARPPAIESEPLSPTGSLAGEIREFSGLALRFCWCPPGEFDMTTGMGDLAGGPRERLPVHVELTQGFWLAETELTQSSWRSVMATEPWLGQRDVRNGDKYPALFISWSDARDFCDKLTELERSAGRLPSGWRYRLPYEAEWEYACRAGSTTAYTFGDDVSELGRFAWYDANSRYSREVYAHEVGLKEPNAWGLRDMHGNVWEWCLDRYAEALEGGRDPQGAASGFERVMRSGSWLDVAALEQSSFRGWEAKYRKNALGFRVALAHSDE